MDYFEDDRKPISTETRIPKPSTFSAGFSSDVPGSSCGLNSYPQSHRIALGGLINLHLGQSIAFSSV